MNVNQFSPIIHLQTDYYHIKYTATLVFECALFMALWVLVLLTINNNWISVGITISVALLRAPLKYWQSTFDPYAR